MAVWIALAIGVAAVVAGLAIDMSGRAPREAGSNHVAPASFVVTVRGGGRLCQPTVALPGDAARVVMTIGTYGPPLPLGTIRFSSASGALVASARFPAGARQGVVSMPLQRVAGAPPASKVCIAPGGAGKVALAGQQQSADVAPARVRGGTATGLVSLIYLRAGRESWWDLLGTLNARFGRGKAGALGDWTLVACALAVLALWIGVLRLVVRELT